MDYSTLVHLISDLRQTKTKLMKWPIVHISSNIHRESKKGDTILLSISLLNIDRFSQFLHRRTQLELCNKIINKHPTSPQMCCYTTL